MSILHPLGETFGRLTVIELAPPRPEPATGKQQIMYVCRCSCGTERAVYRQNLLRGLSRSCGCRARERAAAARRAQSSPNPSYEAAHIRVRNKRGAAASHTCPCGAPAEHWAYNHADPDERAGDYVRPSGSIGQLRYSVSDEFYVALCRTCHCALDKTMRRVG